MLASDVFCYPANIGLSILHAFGYGLPVVTGDDLASHNPEIEALVPGVNGLTFRHGDSASLAQSLARIFDDRALAASMHAAAHKTVMEKFTVQRMVDGIEAAVRYAASRR
jgi:glycosyltransferase involved in cell wall biosynthesis